MVESEHLSDSAWRWHPVGAGIDAQLPFTLGGDNPLFSAYGAAVGESRGEAATAWGLLIDGSNDWADYYVGVSRVGRDFDPALGFVEANGIQRYVGAFQVFPRPSMRGIRRLKFKLLDWDIMTDLDGQLANAEHEVRPIGVHFQSGDEVELNLQHIEDVPPESFEVFPGSVVRSGSYRDTRAELPFSSSRGRSLSVDLSVSAGGFYDGTSTEVDAAFEFRLAPHVITMLKYGTEVVRRSTGDFTAQSVALRLDFAATPRLGSTLIAQWENQSNRLTINTRLHWSPKPGTDLYLVWNSAWPTGLARGIPWNRPETGAVIGKLVHYFTP